MESVKQFLTLLQSAMGVPLTNEVLGLCRELISDRDAAVRQDERVNIVGLVCKHQEQVIARDGVGTTSDELQLVIERLLPPTRALPPQEANK